ncbi:MAG TPA: hypothetical protein GXX18_04985 [Bacillales bacterium]|nr:hypothetical protein [Bacillales bacterium]
MKEKTIIGLYNIQIRTMDRSASLSIGRAQLIGTNTKIHRNEGFGEQNADGVIRIAPVSITEDSDVIDTNSTVYRPL